MTNRLITANPFVSAPLLTDALLFQRPGGSTFYSFLGRLPGMFWATPEQETMNSTCGNDPLVDDGPALRACIQSNKPILLDGTKDYYVNSGDPASGATSDGFFAIALYALDRPVTIYGSGARIIFQGSAIGDSTHNKIQLQIEQTPTHDFTVITNGVTTVTRQFEGSGFDNKVSRIECTLTPTGINPTDKIKIASTQTIPGMASYQLGEQAVVAEVDYVNKWIYLTTTLQETFTGSAIRVGRYRTNPVYVDNLRFNVADGGDIANLAAAMMWVKGCADPVFRNLRCERSWGHFFIDNSNFNLDLSAYIWDCSPLNGVGYGVIVQSSMLSRITVKGGRCRHMVTCNPNTPAADSFFWRRGRNFGTRVINSQGFGNRNAAFDVHADAVDWTFEGCDAFGSYRGIQSVGAGFQLSGLRTKANDCNTFDCPVGAQILIRASDDNPGVGRDIELNNCNIIGYDRPLVVINSNKTDAQNIGFKMIGGRIGGSANLSGRLIELTRSTVLFKGVSFQPSGGAGGIVFYIRSDYSAGAGDGSTDAPGRSNLRLEDCTWDPSQITGGTWTQVSYGPGNPTEGSTTAADSQVYLGYRAEPAMQVVGNADLALTALSPRRIVFNTPLTTVRNITLPTDAGPPFTFVRKAAASGASALNVGGLANLALGEALVVANPEGVNTPAWMACEKMTAV